MRWIGLATVLLCLGQTETVQFFLGDDGCYGPDVEYVIRRAVDDCETAGGWGTRENASVLIEWYNGDGGMICQAWIRANIYIIEDCTPDLDGDGDVDLRDFALFQVAFDD